MFIDEAKIEVFAGRGGDGIVAYRRELKIEYGGPFGGNGGRGGSIVFKGEEGLSTLMDLRYNKIIKAQNGERGKHKGMYGKNAEDTYILVPVGTTIFDDETNQVIADITKNGEEVVVAKGGRGGRGNMAFQSNANKCPDFCEKGEPGEHFFIRCELRVLADCGLVGFPSVGKSTLISRVSSAKPKIAAYHFTTLVPNLGMVRLPDGRDFVMADLPGIIEGAHKGLGLGLQFLRHIERCKVIVHIIDMAAVDGRDPYADYVAIKNELESYKMNLSKRPTILVANKMDLEGAKENLAKFKKKVKDEIIEISALNNDNLEVLLYKIRDLIESAPEFSLFDSEEIKVKEYGLKEEKKFFEITKGNDGVFEVTGEGIRKLFDMTDFDSDTGRFRFARELRYHGVDDELRRLGVQNGDTVRIFDFEFEFFD